MLIQRIDPTIRSTTETSVAKRLLAAQEQRDDKARGVPTPAPQVLSAPNLQTSDESALSQLREQNRRRDLLHEKVNPVMEKMRAANSPQPVNPMQGTINVIA
jgi:hypothetical protein